MQLAPTKTVISNTNGRVTNFDLSSMDVSHLTNILRKQIYTEHDLAVIREYLTNALDEHAEHKPTQPVDITIPKGDNNYSFKIRDYGHGLSTNDVEGLYIQYGASTKRDSNNQAGCLGIGCKAAFAYGDTFYIESFHDNYHHKYMAALSNDTGQLHHLSSERIPTHIPHGLKISVPIKEEDSGTFRMKIGRYLNYVDKSLYNITNDHFSEGIDLVMTPDKVLLESDEESEYPWQFYTDNPMSTNNAVVVMGNVPYPIVSSNVQEHNQYLENKSLVMHAPLGSLSIAANREQLQYDDRTIMTLQEIDKDIQKTVHIRIQEIINKASSHSDAIRAFEKADKAINPGNTGRYHSINWNDISKYNWNNKPLQTEHECKGEYAYIEHSRKCRYSRAANPAYKWEDKSDRYSAQKGPRIISNGLINKFIIWNPNTHSIGRMRQLVAYNHRLNEKSEDNYITWIIISSRTPVTNDPGHNYEDLVKTFEYYGEDSTELADLPDLPRRAPNTTPTTTTNWDGTITQVASKSTARYVCRINHQESRQADRIQPIGDKEALKPTFYKLDALGNQTNEIRLAFAFKNNKIVFQSDGTPYPYESEQIGSWTHHEDHYQKHYHRNDCALTRALLIMDPDIQVQTYQDENTNRKLVNYYAIPIKRKLPEGFRWFHEYFTEQYEKYKGDIQFKMLFTWSSMSHESTQKLSSHPLNGNFTDKNYAHSKSPIIRKVHGIEKFIHGGNDIHDLILAIRKLIPNHPKYPTRINVDKWVDAYDALIKQFPLSMRLKTSSYNAYDDRRYLEKKGLESTIENAHYAYYKTKPEEDDQD